ncbi:MAG: DegV family protein [Lachnospiraceae bacterium]|nr:DegV family protein [Lachnospiraceae bacterium]
MFEYEIFTDSSSDLPRELVAQYGLHVMQLEVIIDDKPPVLDNEMDSKEFYRLLRNGSNAKTSAVTPGFFETEMRKTLSEGKDILYLGFSSGLSATYNNGVMVIKELEQEFPERKILYTDTLCGSMGQGLVVYYAAKLRESGCSMEETLEKVENVKQRIHHQITVDDLFFLVKGGRLTATSAVVGSVLKFKPIINIDAEGKLFSAGKVRGRKTSIKELFERMKSNVAMDEMNYVFISHGDCLEDAESLAAMIQKEWSNAEVTIGDIGPVIGAHTGPGAVVLLYLGKTIKGT